MPLTPNQRKLKRKYAKEIAAENKSNKGKSGSTGPQIYSLTGLVKKAARDVKKLRRTK